MSNRQRNPEAGRGTADRPNGAATLAKGIVILNVVASSRVPLRFADLQRVTGLPKATLHRMLTTLVAEGLIRCEPGDRRYRLGMRLFEMAHHVWEDFDLRGNAIAAMTALRDATGESVSLAMLDGDQIVYIDELAGSHHIRAGMRLARRDSAYCTAIGKAILSLMPPEDRELLLDRVDLHPFTERTAVDRGRLASQLYLASARGYAMEQEEHMDGVSGIAAAVIDHTGHPVAAIGLTGPSSRLTTRALHRLGPPLIEACRQVSLNAGGSPRHVSSVARPATAPAPGVRVVVDANALLGEAPLWDPTTRALYWVDLVAPALHASDPATGADRVLPLPEIVGGVGLAGGGKLVLAKQSGFTVFDPTTAAEVAHLGTPEGHVRSNRFNGGKCDHRGRFWSGTTDFHGVHGRGGLYCLSAATGCRKVLSNVSQPNGLGWSPDDATLYFADTLARAIYAFDHDADSGAVANRRVFAAFPETRPELPAGLTVDADGFVWCAIWDGWRLHRYAPDGTLERTVILPVPRPSSCVFGGADLRTLFITTARIRVANAILEQAPLCGSVLALDCAVPGRAEPAFRWTEPAEASDAAPLG